MTGDQKIVPGAGAYNPNFNNKPNTPDVKFPKGARKDLADRRGFPGPTKYDTNE